MAAIKVRDLAYARLATVVGVRIEVSVMLSVVNTVRRSRHWYECA